MYITVLSDNIEVSGARPNASAWSNTSMVGWTGMETTTQLRLSVSSWGDTASDDVATTDVEPALRLPWDRVASVDRTRQRPLFLLAPGLMHKYKRTPKKTISTLDAIDVWSTSMAPQATTTTDDAG